MVFEDTCHGRRIDRSYLVFARMADLSSCSINIRHKANLFALLPLRHISGDRTTLYIHNLQGHCSVRCLSISSFEDGAAEFKSLDPAL